jgi:hypothetical protein
MNQNNEEQKQQLTPEEDQVIKDEVSAFVDEAVSVEQHDLRTEFLFGIVPPPRRPLLHCLIMLVLGALLFVVQLIRAVDMHAMKLAMEDKGQMPDGQADVMLWPTILLLFLSYALCRRHSLRATVIGIKLQALAKGFQMSTIDAEDVAIAVRKSTGGILLAVATFSVLMLVQMMLISLMISQYIKHFA